MKRRLVVAGIAAIVAVTAVGTYILTRDAEPWPPEWYVEAAGTPEEHLATLARLRRRARSEQDTDFPPSKAKLDLLRLNAIGKMRPTDARVYFSNHLFVNTLLDGGTTLTGGGSVYVLALRGKFPAPSGPITRRERPRTFPLLVLTFDAATMDHRSSHIVTARDLSPLGESVELDLGEEPR